MTDLRGLSYHSPPASGIDGDRPTRTARTGAVAECFAAVIGGATVHRSSIGCVVPAQDEQSSIAAVLAALLAQTRVPDVIHVVVHNSSDATVEVAAAFSGTHETRTPRGAQFTEVFVHDIGTNAAGTVDALNYGYSLVEGYDYLLSVCGDTIADRTAVEWLESEAVADSRIGRISAIHRVRASQDRGIMARFLNAGQRAHFAASHLRSRWGGRGTAVSGARMSLVSTEALREAMRQSRQSAPWMRASEPEDSLLSLQIRSAGYFVAASSRARASVGGARTFASYGAQQVEGTVDTIDLMWPGQRAKTVGQPLHPHLRSRWRENIGMLADMFWRLGALALLVAAATMDAIVVSPLWLIPPVVAVLLNLRIAYTMTDVRRADVLFAALVLPAEIFLWVRFGHFARSWTQFFWRSGRDDRTVSADLGRGRRGRGMPWIVLFGGGVALAIVWAMITPAERSSILDIGWPLVGAVAAMRSAALFFALVRRHPVRMV